MSIKHLLLFIYLVSFAFPTLAERAFITNQADATVSVIDLSTSKVIEVIPVDENPVGIAIDETNHRFYLTHPDIGLVSAYDSDSYQHLFSVDTGGQPFGIEVDKQGKNMVFVTDWAREAMLVINPKKHLVVDLLGVEAGPSGITIDNDNRLIYIANRESNTVTVLDADRPRKHAVIEVSGAPYAIELSPDGKRVYVTTIKEGKVDIIETEKFTLVKSLKVGKSPYDVAVSPDNQKFYVVNQGDSTLQTFDTDNFEQLDSLKVGNMPESIAITDNQNALVVSWFNNSFYSIDLEKNAVINHVETGKGPRAFGNFVAK